jgi:hypothetical protein
MDRNGCNNLGSFTCGRVDKKAGQYGCFLKLFEMWLALKKNSCLGLFEIMSVQSVLILSSKLFLCIPVLLFATVFTDYSYSTSVIYVLCMSTALTSENLHGRIYFEEEQQLNCSHVYIERRSVKFCNVR